ncbi:MAG: RNA polymerase sigma factor, partial [Cytophagaceae bacterium]|nr:RNA polymerase sigma factor [Cytophagaceae bacterium]
EKYADNVYRFVLKNIKDEDKACDIVQDAYEKMWRHRSGIDASKSKSYLFTTAYHVLVDAVRKEKYTVSIEQTGVPDIYDESGSYSDLNEILHKAVELLPAPQKMAVMLRDYEGYSYEEIGEITGLSESQVKVYIYRARLFLKNYIGKPEVVL